MGWQSVLQNHSAGKEDYSEGGKYFERFYSLDLDWILFGFHLDFVWILFGISWILVSI